MANRRSARAKTPDARRQVRSSAIKGTRRERLLEAARQLFFTRGYEAARMEDIASRAGFSKRTVYLEFPSKGVLYATLCEEAIGILRDRLVPVLGERLGVLEELSEIAKRYLGFYTSHRGHYRMLFLWATDDVLADVPPAQKKRLKEEEAVCVGVLARAIDRGRAEGVLGNVDSWQHAMMVWGALNGVLLIQEHSMRVDLAGVPVQDLYWQLVSVLVRGSSDQTAATSKSA
jgi:AcrR family transcriptional regulator